MVLSPSTDMKQQVGSLRHTEPCCNRVANTSAHQIQVLDEATEPDIFSTCHTAMPMRKQTIPDTISKTCAPW